MKKITNIKQVSSNKYEIVIDNKKHIVYDDVLLKYNILKAKEISDEVYKDIVSANNYYEGYNKCLKFILAKMRTEKELRDKLTKLSVSKADQDKIIERLRIEHYIDDDKYVQSYINDNILLTLNGPKKIALNLKKNGFTEDLINKYLNKIEDSVWFEKAEKILNKKLKAARGISNKKFILKLKKDYQNMGYQEIHYSDLLNSIAFDDSSALEKDYQKYYLKLSKKYSEDKLDIMIKQKLFQLGYSQEKIEKISK